jgi:hypothetical protein
MGVLLAAALLLIGGGGAGAVPRQERRTVEVEGRPVIHGNEPFTYVVIETPEGTQYYVHPDQQEKIRNLPPKLYLFRGRIQPGPPATIEAARFPAGTLIVESWQAVGEKER